jgi:hypothetical protein
MNDDDNDGVGMTCDFTTFVNLTTLRVNQMDLIPGTRPIFALPPLLSALDIDQYRACNEITQNWPATLTAIRVGIWSVSQSTAAHRFPTLSHLSASADVNDLPATITTLKIPNFKMQLMDYCADDVNNLINNNLINTIPPAAWPSGLTRLDCEIVGVGPTVHLVIVSSSRVLVHSLLPHSLTCLAGEWGSESMRSYWLAPFVQEPCAPKLTSLSISFGFARGGRGWGSENSETVASSINPYLRVLVNLEKLRLSRVSLRMQKAP